MSLPLVLIEAALIGTALAFLWMALYTDRLDGEAAKLRAANGFTPDDDAAFIAHLGRLTADTGGASATWTDDDADGAS